MAQKQPLPASAYVLRHSQLSQGLPLWWAWAVLNIALAPVFIYALNLGLAGAATATVISQFCVLLYVLLVLGRESTPIRLGFGHYSYRICGKILSVGSMPFLIVVLDNMLIILLNAMLRQYGDTLGDKDSSQWVW